MAVRGYRGVLLAYRLEILLAALGLVFLANAAAGWLRFHRFQSQHQHAFIQPSPTINPASKRIADGVPIGRLSVPRLGLSTTIVEGDGDSSLQLGAGHARESAPLGSVGNTVVAGHRDAAFWPLRNLRVGDRIRLTADRRYDYIVRSLTVVDPSDTALLQPSATAVLTLVTCYPFRHVGPAPQRMVIRAALLTSSLKQPRL